MTQILSKAQLTVPLKKKIIIIVSFVNDDKQYLSSVFSEFGACIMKKNLLFDKSVVLMMYNKVHNRCFIDIKIRKRLLHKLEYKY